MYISPKIIYSKFINQNLSMLISTFNKSSIKINLIYKINKLQKNNGYNRSISFLNIIVYTHRVSKLDLVSSKWVILPALRMRNGTKSKVLVSSGCGGGLHAGYRTQGSFAGLWRGGRELGSSTVCFNEGSGGVGGRVQHAVVTHCTGL